MRCRVLTASIASHVQNVLSCHRSELPVIVVFAYVYFREKDLICLKPSDGFNPQWQNGPISSSSSLMISDSLTWERSGERLRLPIWTALLRAVSGSRISMQRLHARPRGRCYLAARTIASCQRTILQYTGIWIVPLSANSIY
jgi:hypothetical protein